MGSENKCLPVLCGDCFYQCQKRSTHHLNHHRSNYKYIYAQIYSKNALLHATKNRHSYFSRTVCKNASSIKTNMLKKLQHAILLHIINIVAHIYTIRLNYTYKIFQRTWIYNNIYLITHYLANNMRNTQYTRKLFFTNTICNYVV